MAENVILLVDDEPPMRELVREYLGPRFEVVEAASCAEAAERITSVRPAAAIIDYRLPDGDALDLLVRLQEADPDLPVLILTAHGSIELAVEAMRRGAEHFLTKPIQPEALVAILERCLDNRRTRRKKRGYEADRDRRKVDPFRGTSAAVARLFERVRKAAAADRPLLLLGETGCGKGVLARWLHDNGARAHEPFVELNCAGLKPELLENEIFGHERGAYTGADQAKRGLLEVADRGTLFLDEIGDMDLTIQAKLLKVLEEQVFRRLGGVSERRVDVRLLAATHERLDRLVRAKLFRSDLYFRINTLSVEIPPLRERREDVPHLAEYYLEWLGREVGRSGLALAADAVEALMRYRWPGNIRELRNVLERAVLLTGNAVLRREDLQFEAGLAGGSTGKDTASITLAELERLHVRDVLEREGGSRTRAARTLGISRSTLYEKMKRHGLDLPRR